MVGSPPVADDRLTPFSAYANHNNDLTNRFVSCRMDGMKLAVSGLDDKLMADFTLKGAAADSLANFTPTVVPLEPMLGWHCVVQMNGVADSTLESFEINCSNGVQMDVFRPWLVGLNLSIAAIVRAGYDPQSGVELVLKARAEAAGKPVHGLETIDRQIGILAGMSEADQLAFLRSLLEAWEDATVELDRMVGAWATGDVALLEEIAVDEMQSQSPVLYEALLVQRNTDWANQIQTLMEGSGTIFIAVGAAHLAGDDSVQEILADRGVVATRQ